jgi:hypothetical protein
MAILREAFMMAIEDRAHDERIIGVPDLRHAIRNDVCLFVRTAGSERMFLPGGGWRGLKDAVRAIRKNLLNSFYPPM